MSRDRVTALPASLSKYRTSITRFFADELSLLSSVISENRLVLQCSMTVLLLSGAMALLTIMVVFCRPHENFFAVSLSGNMRFITFVKWSASKNDKLCSATIFANKVSATITSLVMSWSFGLTKNDVTGLLREARSNCWCCDVAAWRIASYFPPAATLKCELHMRQYACDTHLSRRLI